MSQAQLRDAAQILFPDLWETDRNKALIDTLLWFDDPIFKEAPPAVPKQRYKPRYNHQKLEEVERSAEIIDLEDHLRKYEIHVSAAAKAIGVNAVTLYSWFHGNSNPKPENQTRIRNFLARTSKDS